MHAHPSGDDGTSSTDASSGVPEDTSDAGGGQFVLRL